MRAPALPANRPALEVDLGALGRNAQTLRARSGCEVGAVVKADAYGLGAEEVSRHLAEHGGISSMFVAYAVEGRTVRHAVNRPGIDPVHLYVLNGYHEADATRYDLLSLRPVLNDRAQAAAWAQRGGACALGVDVGMNRLGLDAAEVPTLCEETGLDPRDVKLVIAHLSHAGSPGASQNAAQVDRFESLVRAAREGLPKAKFSLSASGGIALPAAPSETLTRPGISLYGASCDGSEDGALETVARLTAPVILTRTVGPGETAGYDGRWRATRESRLAVLSIGYADGYPRAIFPEGYVMLNGARCPLAGTVSMDTVIADVTDAGPVRLGDRAELFGPALSVDRAARMAGTIGYEMLTSVGERVERRYRR